MALYFIQILPVALLYVSSTTSIIVPHFPKPSRTLYPYQRPYDSFGRPLDRVDQENSQAHRYNFNAPYTHSNNRQYDPESGSHDFENQLYQPEDQGQSIHDFAEPPVNNLEDEHDTEGRFGFQQQQHHHGHRHHHHHYSVNSVPVSEHVEVSRPVPVPVYKEIGIPFPHPVKISVPHPVTVPVPQPYPVAVPVSHPVPIHVVKTVAVPVEKKIPYPVEKHIPVPIEKPVPITIEKHIPVPVYKPYPIKVPVYKTIYHHAKRHYGR